VRGCPDRVRAEAADGGRRRLGPRPNRMDRAVSLLADGPLRAASHGKRKLGGCDRGGGGASRVAWVSGKDVSRVSSSLRHTPTPTLGMKQFVMGGGCHYVGNEVEPLSRRGMCGGATTRKNGCGGKAQGTFPKRLGAIRYRLTYKLRHWIAALQEVALRGPDSQEPV
jgi:hypothetical protein